MPDPSRQNVALAPTRGRANSTAGIRKPSPVPRNDTGSAVAVDEIDGEPTVEEPLDTAPPRRSKLVTKLVASLVVLVVCAGATAWFTWKTNTALSTSPLSNTALSDAAGSTEVIGQATQAVEQVFSYTYTDLPKTERAMNSWLTGRAVEQYQALYGQLKTQAAQQKLTLQTTVRTIGVVSLQGDRAELLAFLDQRAVREGTATPSTGGGQLKIVAERAGGTWKVSDFGTL
ncbi:hypothetical protein AB0J40_12445 [Amycolatopsis sp. NPDC049691]|uniref:hypothetical protein n=1 Tax=Amycolatopsis sp. NPDC049691 TaxID=3155155 RepID=UPI00342BB76B